MSEDIPVAIIMRCKDEFPHVERALKALQEQSYQNFVLYTIDSGSTDGSWECILKYNPFPDRIVRIRPEDYVPGRVLNLMVAMAKERLVVFLNADAVPLNRFWLENLLRPILDGSADATMSRQLPRQDAYFIVCYDYLRAFDRKNIEGKNEDFFSAVACAFRRELWEENKFYVDGFSEDMAWAKVCREQGYRFQLVEASLVEHSHNYTARQLYRRGFIEGEAEVLIYGKKAQLLEQLYLCTRELVRDFFYALRKGCFWTIPYNIFYRAACHWGFYQGKRAGEARQRSVKMSNEGAQEQSPKPLSATGE